MENSLVINDWFIILKKIQGAYISLPKFIPFPGSPSEASIDLLVISFLNRHNFFCKNCSLRLDSYTNHSPAVSNHEPQIWQLVSNRFAYWFNTKVPCHTYARKSEDWHGTETELFFFWKRGPEKAWQSHDAWPNSKVCHDTQLNERLEDGAMLHGSF